MLPFTKDQFFSIFVAYGEAIWPLQIFAYATGFAVMAAILAGHYWSNRFTLFALAAMWLATGALYHLMFFSKINNVAYVFGTMFILQGLSFAYLGVLGPALKFEFRNGFSDWLGLSFAIYAILVYPAVGLWLGHSALEIPAFGLTP